MGNTQTSITGRVHDRLGTYGKKEFHATGADSHYYQGYCDALEWVVNHVLPNGDGDGHVGGDVYVDTGDRRTFVSMGELFPQVGKNKCRVCTQEVQPPKQVYCSDYCRTIAVNVQKLFSWQFVRDFVATRDGECVRCGDDGPYEVDHIIPDAHGGHPFDPDNLQRLCEDCHDEKGMSETDFRNSGNGGVRLFPGGSAGQLTFDTFDGDTEDLTSDADSPGDTDDN